MPSTAVHPPLLLLLLRKEKEGKDLILVLSG
jgi:hypothetical protein